MDPYLIHSGIVGMNSVWNSIFGRAAKKKKLTMPTPPKISWTTLFCRSFSRLLWHAPDVEWSPYLLGMNGLKSPSYQGGSFRVIRKNGNSAYNEQVTDLGTVRSCLKIRKMETKSWYLWISLVHLVSMDLVMPEKWYPMENQKRIIGYHWFICLHGVHWVHVIRSGVHFLDLSDL